MIVTSLVLVAVLLSIIAVVVSFIPSRRLSAIDESAITDPVQLDAAIAIQRSDRIAELQRRTTKKNYWSYALLGIALLAQMAALAVDRTSIDHCCKHIACPVGGIHKTGLATSICKA